MTALDELLDRVKRLEAKLDGTLVRLGVLERAMEETLDIQPLASVRRVVEIDDTKKVAAAINLGSQLSDARKSARAAKESATNLRKVLTPSEDTGKHDIDKDK